MKRGEPESRQCMKCGTPITACNGFVLMRDLLPVLEGNAPDEVREACGRCVDFIDPATII